MQTNNFFNIYVLKNLVKIVSTLDQSSKNNNIMHKNHSISPVKH